jgi:hypothetical protein
VSGNFNRQLGMDKLQNEYEALQQKLALLKRDTNRDNGRLQASTPMSAMQQRKADPGTAQAPATGSTVPNTATSGAIAAAATGQHDSAAILAAAGAGAAAAARTNSSGDGGSLGLNLSVLQSCEYLQLHCSIPDAAGIMQSLQFASKHPGSRVAQLASSTFCDSEFLASCEHALSAQLQRTKDGATDKSRIAELAGALLWQYYREKLLCIVCPVTCSIRIILGAEPPWGTCKVPCAVAAYYMPCKAMHVC